MRPVGLPLRESVSSLCRGHANLLCIVPIFSYVTPKGTMNSQNLRRVRKWFCILFRLRGWLQSGGSANLDPHLKPHQASVAGCTSSGRLKAYFISTSTYYTPSFPGSESQCSIFQRQNCTISSDDPIHTLSILADETINVQDFNRIPKFLTEDDITQGPIPHTPFQTEA